MADIPTPAHIIKGLEDAAEALRHESILMEDGLIGTMRRAESRIFGRMAVLLQDAPMDQALRNKLAWYAQNADELRALVADEPLWHAGIRQYLAAYDALAELSEAQLLAGGMTEGMAAIPDSVVAALRQRDLEFFNFLNLQGQEALDNVLLEQLMTTQKRAGMLAELRGVITGDYPWGTRRGLYEWHAGTYARTGHLRFARTIQAAQASEAGVDQFLYIGPADGKTRAFCNDRVGKVFTQAEIEQMNNGQTGNVMTDGGGWNCRHTWAAVLDAVAKALRANQEAVLIGG